MWKMKEIVKYLGVHIISFEFSGPPPPPGAGPGGGFDHYIPYQFLQILIPYDFPI